MELMGTETGYRLEIKGLELLGHRRRDRRLWPRWMAKMAVGSIYCARAADTTLLWCQTDASHFRHPCRSKLACGSAATEVLWTLLLERPSLISALATQSVVLKSAPGSSSIRRRKSA